MPSVSEWLSNRRNGARTQDIAVWSKCPNCGEVVYRKDLAANAFVCPRCKYHFRMTAFDRIVSLIDGEFTEIGADIVTGDPLEWTDKRSYPDKLNADREKSGLSEAVVCGFGRIGEFEVGLGVMDFHFRGGTMGSVVGERIALLLEESARRNVPCIIFTASGGARMEEGMLALAQLAKTSAAVARFSDSGNLFVTVLTDPTTGGVSASFAFQSDIVIAESRAVIGFAGRRVIEQTIRQKLPDQFQTAEFLLEKGAIDMVVERPNVKDTLTRLLEYTKPVAR
jgi:acetyl-CoA carboxylase carboxyl transferase subunit beta